MAFQIVPFFDDDWPMTSPWESRISLWPRDDQRRPRGLMSQLLRDVDKLKKDAGLVARDDAFEVALDVNGFDPKELQVNVSDNFLTMSGRHEENSPDGSRYVSRSFTRKYHLPENVNQDEFKSCLTNDGKTLRIMAPLKSIKEPESKAVPIEISREKPTAIQEKKG